MAFEFNPYYFERDVRDDDYEKVVTFVGNLQKTLDKMSSIDEVYSLISFFEEKGEVYYPIFLLSMCAAAFVAAQSFTHPRFETDGCVIVKKSFPEWEDYKLDVPRYIFVREYDKFPHAVRNPAQRKDNFSKLFKLYLESFNSMHGVTNRVYYEIFSAQLRISGIRILIHDTNRGLEFKVVDGKSLLYKALSKDGSSIEILD